MERGHAAIILSLLGTWALVAVCDTRPDPEAIVYLDDCGDNDQDGYINCDDDCDDENPRVHPHAEDALGDNIDQNCDGVDGVMDTDT